MSTEFASASLTAGQLNAIVKKLGGPEKALDFLRGKLAVSAVRLWREEGGAIYFSVTSDGTTGKGWIKRLEGEGFYFGERIKEVLCSLDFKPTSGVTTEVAVLKGTLFEDDGRTTKRICAEAGKRKLSKPNVELACLIREKFTDEEIETMDLWCIVAMHEPIKDSDGDPDLLAAHRGGGGRWLEALGARPGNAWNRNFGFAFVVSQVGPKP